jgi:hypothetical protein
MVREGEGGSRSGSLSRLMAWAPAAILVIGLPSLVIAFVVAIRDLGDVPVPSPLRWVGATAAIMSFLLLASASYASLVPESSRRLAHHSFLRSQLMKYNPFGAVAQPTSQALLTSSGTGGSTAAVATVVSKVTTGAGGLLWGPVVAATGAGLPHLVRVGCALAPVGLLVCHPAVLGPVIRRAPRLGGSVVVPESARIARSVGLAFLAVGFAGLGFLLVAPTDSPMGTGPAPVAGFAFTWTLGYLALPFPGGVGVREAIATILVPGATAAVLVTAVVFRVTQIGVELALTMATYAHPLRAGPPAPARPASSITDRSPQRDHQ